MHIGVPHFICKRADSRNDLALCAACAIFDDSRRHVQRQSCRRKAVRHLPERRQSHEEHECAARAYKRVKIDRKRSAYPCMRGYDVHRRAEVAVRHRDTGERRNSQRTRHARQHAERHTVRFQVFAFLAAASEQVAVTALEADGALSLLRKLHQYGVDLVLRHRMMPHFLADADALRAFRDEVEDALIDQPVIHDRVRLLECRTAAARQKRCTARSCADECYCSRHVSSSACRCRRSASVQPSSSAVSGAPVSSPLTKIRSSSLTYSPRRRSTPFSSTA